MVKVGPSKQQSW